MKRLLKGVDNFKRNGFPQREKLFRQLSQGQTPLALFITCSDSRVDPSLITNTEPGEIFVLRNAGNLVSSNGKSLGEAATIEYAVKVLAVPDIVICGHTQCGAMAALLNPASCADLPAVTAWLASEQPRIDALRREHSNLADEPLLDLVVQENVIAQLAALREHPSVRERLENESLQLHGWVYSIASGEVTVFDPALRGFISPDIALSRT